ncbi:hypothetical protein ABPG72_016479 [Tetrahymena utriculariae]
MNTCNQCQYGYQNDKGQCILNQKIAIQNKSRKYPYQDTQQQSQSQIYFTNPINQTYKIFYNLSQYNNITYCSDFDIQKGCQRCYDNYQYSQQDQKCLPIKCGDNQYPYQNQCQNCSSDKIIVKKNEIIYCQTLNQTLASVVSGQVQLAPNYYLFDNGQYFEINSCQMCIFEYECEECFQSLTPGCIMNGDPQKCQICNSTSVLDNNGKCQFSQNNNISIYNQVVDNCLSYDINSTCISCQSYFLQDTQKYVTSLPEGYYNQQCACYKCLKSCLNEICTLDCLCQIGQFYNYNQSQNNAVDIKNNCINCDPQCKECQMKSNNCIVCNVNDPNNLDDKQIKCLDKCPQGYYQENNNCLLCKQQNCQNFNSNYCTQCLDGFELINNSCYKTCQQNEFRDQSTFQCNSCNYTCKTCNGPNISDCTSCISQLNLIQGMCSICDQGEFYKGDQLDSIKLQIYDYSQCSTCDNSCEYCQGPSKTDCTKCQGGLQINPQNKLCITQQQLENQNDSINQCQSLEINAKDIEDCENKLNQIQLFKNIDDITNIAVISLGTFFSLFLQSSSIYFWSFLQSQQILGNNYNLAPNIGQGITQNQLQNMNSFNFFNLIQSPFQVSSSSLKQQRILLTTQKIGQFFIENCFYQSLAIILSVFILPLLFILAKFNDKVKSLYNYSKWNLSIRTCMVCSNLFIVFFILGIKNSQFTQVTDDKNILINLMFACLTLGIYLFIQIKSVAFILCYQQNCDQILQKNKELACLRYTVFTTNSRTTIRLSYF